MSEIRYYSSEENEIAELKEQLRLYEQENAELKNQVFSMQDDVELFIRMIIRQSEEKQIYLGQEMMVEVCAQWGIL